MNPGGKDGVRADWKDIEEYWQLLGHQVGRNFPPGFQVLWN